MFKYLALNVYLRWRCCILYRLASFDASVFSGYLTVPLRKAFYQSAEFNDTQRRICSHSALVTKDGEVIGRVWHVWSNELDLGIINYCWSFCIVCNNMLYQCTVKYCAYLNGVVNPAVRAHLLTRRKASAVGMAEGVCGRSGWTVYVYINILSLIHGVYLIHLLF